MRHAGNRLGSLCLLSWSLELTLLDFLLRLLELTLLDCYTKQSPFRRADQPHQLVPCASRHAQAVLGRLLQELLHASCTAKPRRPKEGSAASANGFQRSLERVCPVWVIRIQHQLVHDAHQRARHPKQSGCHPALCLSTSAIFSGPPSKRDRISPQQSKRSCLLC